MSTILPHNGVALVRFKNAGLKCTARGSIKIQDAKIAKNSPYGHHRTNLSGCIFATKACIDNRKKNLLNSNISCRRSHNMANFGPLTAEIGLPVWGTHKILTGFASCLYCSDVAHRRPTKLCTIFDRLLGWYTVCTFFGGFCP